jgi:hypothetical protein
MSCSSMFEHVNQLVGAAAPVIIFCHGIFEGKEAGKNFKHVQYHLGCGFDSSVVNLEFSLRPKPPSTTWMLIILVLLAWVGSKLPLTAQAAQRGAWCVVRGAWCVALIALTLTQTLSLIHS